MTDDLLARIDALTSCPSCGERIEQQATVLYGACMRCSFGHYDGRAAAQVAALRHAEAKHAAQARFSAAVTPFLR